MKNRWNKILAVVLGSVMAVGCIGMSAYAVSSTTDKSNSETTASGSVAKSESTSTEKSEKKTATGTSNSKEETVYVIAGADGTVEKLIVSEWLQNKTGSDSIKDTTELKDVTNVKGDESYTMSGNSCVWDAKGQDIYYQGTIEKEVPVTMKVTYMLDGKQISAKELAGKSGKVTIKYEYTNNQYEMMDINGKQEKIYVPYAMLTGLMLDNEKFTNVEVTNGKLIDDGQKTIVAGLAFPGLEANLQIGDKISIPDYVEIKADVNNFELENTVTVATSSVFGNLDTDKINADSIKDDLGQLTEGMAKLLDGSSQLYDGLTQLLEKSDQLVTGIKALAAGAEELKNGSSQIAAGAADLSKGATNLKNGLEQVDANSATLKAGALQTFNKLLAQGTEKLQAINPAFPELTVDNYETVITSAKAAVAANPTAVAQLDALLDSYNSYNTFYQGIIAYTAGVSQCTEGAKSLATGALTLKEATAKLATGAEQLYAGVMQLDENTPLLVEGITKLKNGAMQLSDGLKTLDEQGIKKITDLVNGDLEDLTARIRATVTVAGRYKSFAGVADDMDGTTKFIYKTDVIKSND